MQESGLGFLRLLRLFAAKPAFIPRSALNAA